MKKATYQKILMLAWAVLTVLPMALLTSCSESDEEITEFDNWQERNDSFFNEVYNRAKSSSTGEWKVITQWSLNEEMATKAENHIVVQVLEAGTGSGCPIYTDSVYIHYSGRLMPSASYPEGYEFDKSWSGSFNAATSKPPSSRYSRCRPCPGRSVPGTLPLSSQFPSRLGGGKCRDGCL